MNEKFYAVAALCTITAILLLFHGCEEVFISKCMNENNKTYEECEYEL